ncbi:hypothetical protein Asp14428_41560 [Actinoplanes sp. NBRC 14428]|uniref:Uncharacterized protein n=1 Tax=Pseudosporangium ferrugineum TaxID=439699 RepID=A0A2T0S7Z7_9ACTN|nr:hypothetical protein [Pseudosporangium ferrugineum]PRY29551.1 hypothetical protein CLV70_106272 [Pseudosporangium ferrugineum]BCJ52681.1 hypothetical protein Asp14428_41560 [Actinoplanes sp. NBRC 14428]
MSRPSDSAGVLATAAGIGLCGAIVEFVVARHYLQIEWGITLPVPLLWWAAGGVAVVLGAPLLMVSLGRVIRRLVALPWGRLILTWALPCLVGQVVWIGVTLVLLRRYNPGLLGVPIRDVRELLTVVILPPPQLSLLYVLGLFPVLAKATQRLPGVALVALLAAASLLTTTVTFAVFLAVGLRMAGGVDKLVETASWRSLVPRAAVAAAGGAVLAVDRFPAGLAVVVAGLAAVPFGLTLAALIRLRLLAVAGAAAVPAYLLLVPVLALADSVLLPRLSVQGSAVQLAVAVAEPAVLTAGIVLGGIVLHAIGRKVRGRTFAEVNP